MLTEIKTPFAQAMADAFNRQALTEIADACLHIAQRCEAERATLKSEGATLSKREEYRADARAFNELSGALNVLASHAYWDGKAGA